LEQLRNAPQLLLQKKSPPSPSPMGLGSPRSPGSVLVSSSQPVPQKPFHITAVQERHQRESSVSSNNSSQSVPFPSPDSSQTTVMPDPKLSQTPIRPIARRYVHSQTQTEAPDVSDASTQSE